jgi:hypothetical protein
VDPSSQVSGTVAPHHVDHDAFGEIDQPGRVDRRVPAVRGKERRLINTELADGAHPVRVVDQRGAVLDHCVHHGPPAHAELVCDLGHRAGVSTDLAARFHPPPAS